MEEATNEVEITSTEREGKSTDTTSNGTVITPGNEVPNDGREHMKTDRLPGAAAEFDIHFSKPEDVEHVICTEMTLEDITDEHIDLTKRMLKLLASINGLGLAAPQIGIKKTFFVYWETRQNRPHVCYNPKYYGVGKPKQTWGEKCLTYGDLLFAIKRYKDVQAVWYEYDPDTKSFVKVTRALRGLEAEVFQHETDHLVGKTLATDGVMIR